MSEADTVLDRTDVHTLLGVLASELRLHAHAALGMAAEQHRRGSHEHRVTSALASNLGEAAATLDLVREHRCAPCRLATVAVRLDLRREDP